MRPILFFFLSFLLFSCQHKDNFFNGKIVVADTFEQELVLSGNKVVYMDSIGNFQIEVTPVGLVITMYKLSYFAQIFDRQGGTCKGNFFVKGEGPDEFLTFSILNQKQDSVLYVQDFQRKMLYGIDMASTVSSQRSVIKKRIDYNAFTDPLQVFYCGDSLLLVKDVDFNNGVCYYKYNPYNQYKERIKVYHFVVQPADLNYMMSIADCLKPDAKMIVSLTGTLNQIDILNLEDSTANLSFTTSEALITLEDVKANKGEKRDYYLSLPKSSDTLIFALFQQGGGQKEFHVINWSGQALFRLGVNEDLRDFSIDWKQGRLYGITTNDEVYSYNLKGTVL